MPAKQLDHTSQSPVCSTRSAVKRQAEGDADVLSTLKLHICVGRGKTKKTKQQQSSVVGRIATVNQDPKCPVFLADFMNALGHTRDRATTTTSTGQYPVHFDEEYLKNRASPGDIQAILSIQIRDPPGLGARGEPALALQKESDGNSMHKFGLLLRAKTSSTLKRSWHPHATSPSKWMQLNCCSIKLRFISPAWYFCRQLSTNSNTSTISNHSRATT